MAPKLKLYYMFQSPPCRVVMMVLDMLKLKYEAVVIDLLKGQGKTPEYLEVLIIFSYVYISTSENMYCAIEILKC